MKYFSMFSGIGGFEYGISNAYRSKERGSQKDTQTNKGQGLFPKTSKSISTSQRQVSECNNKCINERPLCIGYSEIDKYAIQIYEKHYKGVKNYGDITKIKPKELPDFDLLVGGFPCQAFSIAGKRKGFDDTRGTLFFDIARILKDKRPRYLVLENVKGLLSHDGGKTFQTILKVLTDLGYSIEWQVLNSKNFGVPQNRERVFIVGHLRGERKPKVFPFGESTKKTIKYDVSGSQRDRVYNKNGLAPTIPTMQGGNTHPKIISSTNRRTNVKLSKTVNTLTSHYRGNPDGDGRPGLLKDMKIRRLTPVECERLQGFPDGWTEGLSDTQRYKTLGNAVTTNVITAIFNKLLKEIL